MGLAEWGDRLVKFISTKGIKPNISDELADVIKNPIKFKTERGNIAHGYEATILPDICEAVLKARQAGHLNVQQKKRSPKGERRAGDAISGGVI